MNYQEMEEFFYTDLEVQREMEEARGVRVSESRGRMKRPRRLGDCCRVDGRGEMRGRGLSGGDARGADPVAGRGAGTPGQTEAYSRRDDDDGRAGDGRLIDRGLNGML